MNILNNREIVIALLVAGVFVWSITHADIRKSFAGVLKCLCNTKILFTLVAMFLYIAMVVYLLESIGIWTPSQSKTTLIWVLSVALVSLFGINEFADDPHAYCVTTVNNLFRLIVVLEFVVNFYVFPLWAEFFIVPLLTIFTLMHAVADVEKEHAIVKKFLGHCFVGVGILLAAHAFYKLATDFVAFATMDTLRDFGVPIVLTFLYMPFIVLVAVYASYETVFVKLQFVVKDRKLLNHAKRKARLAFGLNIYLLKQWARNIRMDSLKTKKDVACSIREARVLWRREKNPPPVSFEHGWSPYLAGDFLVAEGITTDDYHKGYDGWISQSPALKASDGAFSDDIHYYVEGTETVANTLRLTLNINNLKLAGKVKKKFVSVAEKLFHASLNGEMPKKVKSNLLREKNYIAILHGKEIAILIERISGHFNNGYEIEFEIRNPKNSVRMAIPE